MKHIKAILAGAALAAAPAGISAAAVDYSDLYPDTWVAIDGLERVMPSADENPFKDDKERTVGIFYVSWHWDFFHEQFNSPYDSDVTKILEQDPTARLDWNNPLWPHGFSYHWGEPELGYFTSGDKYVIRKDISMLTDAGVDVLILDMTNGTLYPEAWDALFDTMTEMKKEGNKVPKFCFWGYNDGQNTVPKCVDKIYEYYYYQKKYQDLWYYMDGKPLLLYNENKIYQSYVKDFFTLRHMWWGYRVAADRNGRNYVYVGSEDHWSFGYDMHDKGVSDLTPAQRASYHNGRAEQMAVTPAQHASTMVGKSWTVKGGEPGLNQYDLPAKKYLNKKWVYNVQERGLYFADRWNEALSVDPDFIYINDWNEWTAGQFPGNCTFMGRSSNYQFVDQYNAEFNRTIQPMKGGGTDNYYMQMIDGIRRYKGVREAPVAAVATEADASCDFSVWEAMDTKFLDTPGDVTHRNYTGYGGNVYKNVSGRNDILLSKVNVKGDNISFYVETSNSLSPKTDPNWMLLFLNTDCDYRTGWEGFDFLLNKEFTADGKSCIKRWDSEAGEWKDAGIAEMRLADNKLVLTMPLATLGIEEQLAGQLYFKWADNPADLENAISLCIDGDTAPNRRFAYNFRWEYEGAGVAETSVGINKLKAFPLTGNAVKVETTGNFKVVNLLGATVAEGAGDATVTLPSSGPYIVCGTEGTIKIIL